MPSKRKHAVFYEADDASDDNKEDNSEEADMEIEDDESDKQHASESNHARAESESESENESSASIEEMKAQLAQMQQQRADFLLEMRKDPDNIALQSLFTQIDSAVNLLTEAIEEKGAALAPPRYKGRVLSYSVRKGFGFISPLEDIGAAVDERGLFAHKSQIVCTSGTPFLVTNADITFEVGKSDDGRLCAQQIKDIDSAPLDSYENALPLDLYSSVSSTAGRKDTQEDRYLEGVRVGDLGCCYGVFDGHGGSACSEYISSHLHRQVGAHLHKSTEKACKKAILEGFSETDKNWLQMCHRQSKLAEQGSTALLVFIQGDTYPTKTSAGNLVIYCANLGDCRALLCRNGKAVRLSEDHKPDRPDERVRIQQAGGAVVKVGTIYRVTTAQGGAMMSGGPTPKVMPRALAVSRSIGDSDLKTAGDKGQALVSAVPDISMVKVDANDAFIVIACDGVWDVLSDQEVVDLIKPHFGKRDNSGATAVVEAALNKNSEDNLTVLVIQFPWIIKEERSESVLYPNGRNEEKAEAVEEKQSDDLVDDLYGE